MSLNIYSRNTIDFYTAANNFSTQQDTIKKSLNLNSVLDTDSLAQKNTNSQDTSLHQTIRKINFSAIDSILKSSAERERQIHEQVQAEQLQRDAAIQRWIRRQRDTTEILYKEFGIASFPIKEQFENDLTQQNFLYNFLSVKPEARKVSDIVFIESESQEIANSKTKTISTTEKQDIIPKVNPGRLQFDWITIVLIVSILLVGWVQLLNKKYLTSLIKSIVSFQESTTLYREKNSLMEKASFMVNILFLSNISIFIIQLFYFYSIEIDGLENYMLYFIGLGFFISLHIFRLLTSSMIGFVFLKQKVFSEFFHNVNIYTKGIGLALLPVIISLQFLLYEYLAFIVYAGIVFIIILYLLHIVRSFQIIIRKNVSISYMILYLCAFEFAPFLIMYKVIIRLVQ